MTLVRHELGPVGAAYLRDYFESSRRYGRRLGALLAARDLEAGTTWAFVPSDSAPQRVLDVRHGGLYSRPGYEKPRVSPRPDVQRWLKAQLGGPGRSILCCEDAMRQRTDPAQGTSDTPAFFCGDDVYWYSEQPEDVVRIPWPCATWHPAIAMVTEMPRQAPPLEHRLCVPPEALQEMADGAAAVVVGAWDAEGWLIWEPAGSVAQAWASAG